MIDFNSVMHLSPAQFYEIFRDRIHNDLIRYLTLFAVFSVLRGILFGR